MWTIAEFTGDALNELEHMLGGFASGEKIWKITFGVDGNTFKLKVNEGRWTPPLVMVEQRP